MYYRGRHKEVAGDLVEFFIVFSARQAGISFLVLATETQHTEMQDCATAAGAAHPERTPPAR